MSQRSAIGVAILGSILIALTYGASRFAFGLFLPEISDHFGIDEIFAGAIGATPFVTFVCAVLLAPYVVRLLGTRLAAGTACFAAFAGLLSISFAPSIEVLILGLAICGVSTGISSPIMAHAVHFTVSTDLRGRVNSVINAGTSIGIAASVPAVMLFSDAWRHAYQAFGTLAVITGLAAVIYLPGRHQSHLHLVSKIPGPMVTRQQWLDIGCLSALAAITGFTSAIYWMFAPDFAISAGGLSVENTALMWLAVALGGILGAGAGDMIARHGHVMSHAFTLTVLAASLVLLGANPGHVAFAYGSAGAFGAAYMTLTGFYLVRGTEIMTGHPALGPILPLIATAGGQIIGAPVAGGLIAEFAYQLAFGIFAGFALIIAVLSVMVSPVLTKKL